MSFEVRVPIQEFKEIRDSKWRKYLDDVTRAVGNNVRKRLPGLLRSSLGRFQTGELAKTAQVWVDLGGVRVEFPVEHAKYVFEGVSPHVMDTTARGYPMVWDHAASRVPKGIAYRVNHPGQAARYDVIEEIKMLVLEELLFAMGGFLQELT